MRKPAKRCKAQPQQVSLVKFCFTSAGEGILLGVNEQAHAK